VKVTTELNYSLLIEYGLLQSIMHHMGIGTPHRGSSPP